MRILTMLAEGKITAEETEALLDALAAREGASAGSGGGGTAAGNTTDAAAGPAITGDPTPLVQALPKYLYVKVNAVNGDNVDVKVPLALVRSGLKLTSLIPSDAMDQINDSLSENGISIDFNNLKPEDVDELITALREMEITVDAGNGDKVRVYAA
jgi:hypothetical protein